MRNRSVVILFVLVFVTLFNLGGWPFEVRFTCTPLNYWFTVLLCIALPISAIAAAYSSRRRIVQVLGVISAILIGLPTFLFGMLAAVEAVDIHKRGYDASFELLKEVSSGLSSYRLYRTNCGATCAFGLELRRELETPVGVKFVQSIWSKYREDDADLRLLPETEIQILQNGILVASVKL